MSEIVYTIGHSNGSLERLLGMLRRHEITAVADVRSRPYSKFNSQFNREMLTASFKNARIEYVFLGQELGARSEDSTCYRDGRAQYSLIAKSALFKRGIARLRAGMERFQIAILCAEKEPLACHRAILISRHLYEKGVDVRHILEDGSVEPHQASLVRLLQMHDIQENHLFHSADELIEIAYQKQAEAIEYTASQESQPA